MDGEKINVDSGAVDTPFGLDRVRVGVSLSPQNAPNLAFLASFSSLLTRTWARISPRFTALSLSVEQCGSQLTLVTTLLPRLVIARKNKKTKLEFLDILTRIPGIPPQGFPIGFGRKSNPFSITAFSTVIRWGPAVSVFQGPILLFRGELVLVLETDQDQDPELDFFWIFRRKFQQQRGPK